MNISEMMKRMMGGQRCAVCGFPIEGQGNLTWWNKPKPVMPMCFQCCTDPKIHQHVIKKSLEMEDDNDGDGAEGCETGERETAGAAGEPVGPLLG